MNWSANARASYAPASNPKVFILHENGAWVTPLRTELKNRHIPFEEWFINQTSVDLASIPPEGIFYNRMSASSHTRDHRYAIEISGPIISWLQAHGRTVINNRRALQLEVRKMEQYLALHQFGLQTPRTIAVNNMKDLLHASVRFTGKPFIIKPNRGGKGTGVQLFENTSQLEASIKKRQLTESLDGIYLIQDYILPKGKSIVRMEFIGGQFYYAVKVDASNGFELCPADECSVEQQRPNNYKFEILENYQNPDIPKCEQFLKANGMTIAAIEYAERADGQRFIYDVNINTNYNQEAEVRSAKGYNGMGKIADYLGQQVEKLLAKQQGGQHAPTIQNLNA